MSLDHDEDSTSDNITSHHKLKEDPSAHSSGLKLANRESKALWGLRWLVFAVLLLSAIAVALLTFFLIRKTETDEFNAAFKDNAIKILQSLGSSVEQKISGADAFVATMLSYARDAQQIWPNVTIPDFEARAQRFLSLTNAVVFDMYLLVTRETRLGWEAYAAVHGPDWVDKSMSYLRRNDLFQDVYEARNISEPTFLDFIHDYSAWGVENPQALSYDNPGPFLPLWQTAPLIPKQTIPIYNWDLATVVNKESVLSCIQDHKVAVSKAYMIADPGDKSLEEENEAWADYFSSYITSGENPMEPLSDFYYPMILDLLDHRSVRSSPDYDPSQHQIAGILSQSIYWRDMIKDILPQDSNGYLAVFKTPCNPKFTYEINGRAVRYVGAGDLHDSKYDNMGVSSSLRDLIEIHAGNNGNYHIPIAHDVCPWNVIVYPSPELENAFVTTNPLSYSAVTFCIFVFVAAIFLLYDFMVERRQRIVMASAIQTNNIVSSLYPANVRDRLLERRDSTLWNKATKRTTYLGRTTKSTQESLPIADLFPEVSVLFADLAGFTAWSSTREPVHVFILLESLYGEFDKIAKRRGVFKVETVGDCYVAAVGLPIPRENHPVVMVRFAADCRDAVNTLTCVLEATLGPGTADLKLRVGIHSGSVTAGVLRGEKGRFQLFGDTVNTASRMESNGIPNRIHVSQATADLLVKGGKGNWLDMRRELIFVKGKGQAQTYWAEPRRENAEQIESDHDIVATEADHVATAVAETKRLLDWNASVFEKIVKRIIACRSLSERVPSAKTTRFTNDFTTVRDAVEAIDVLPFIEFEPIDPSTITLDSKVAEQLYSLMSAISRSYRANPFHSFEHASHVAMAANKIVNRIIAPAADVPKQTLYNNTWGLALDPLAQLAIVFSALIHECDHRGCPNSILMKEDPSLAARYKGKSIAEQHSLNVGWEVLMDPAFADLRACLFESPEDLQRFRQMVVNAVLATDISDPELQRTCDQRWETAFAQSEQADDPVVFRKRATIVFEYIMQASAICHTMQHWTIYQKWNKCLFDEMYAAYSAGKLENDPVDCWYQGELSFFDNYVLPLSMKVNQCGLIGAFGEVFVQIAQQNREEWERKGPSIVEDLKRSCVLME